MALIATTLLRSSTIHERAVASRTTSFVESAPSIPSQRSATISTGCMPQHHGRKSLPSNSCTSASVFVADMAAEATNALGGVYPTDCSMGARSGATTMRLFICHECVQWRREVCACAVSGDALVLLPSLVTSSGNECGVLTRAVVTNAVGVIRDSVRDE